MISRRSLRAMRARWQKDLDRLEAAYVAAASPTMEGGGDSEHETVRNLATAIAEIDGLITARRSGDDTRSTTTHPAPLPSDADDMGDGAGGVAHTFGVAGHINDKDPQWAKAASFATKLSDPPAPHPADGGENGT